MSYPSSPDSSQTNPTISQSSSQNDGIDQVSVDENSASLRYMDGRSSIESTEQNSIRENSSFIPSPIHTILPSSTAVISSRKVLESISKLEHSEMESRSFDSHELSNRTEKVDFDSKEIMEVKLDEDQRNPPAEEQESSHEYESEHLSTRKKLSNTRDPIENLVLATLAFKEASFNQCDLLRLQTIAINRLATAIEDQNSMMSRFHTIVTKPSTKNLDADTEQ